MIIALNSAKEIALKYILLERKAVILIYVDKNTSVHFLYIYINEKIQILICNT